MAGKYNDPSLINMRVNKRSIQSRDAHGCAFVITIFMECWRVKPTMQCWKIYFLAPYAISQRNADVWINFIIMMTDRIIAIFFILDLNNAHLLNLMLTSWFVKIIPVNISFLFFVFLDDSKTDQRLSCDLNICSSRPKQAAETLAFWI